MQVTEHDIPLADGGSVHAFDTGPASGDHAIVWHHGSPQTGAPLEPLLVAARERGIRVFSVARPSYGGSTPRPGRDVASVAADIARVADVLGIERFAAMGASGGGPHALACAATLPAVVGAVTVAGIAPHTDAFAWFAGMVAPGGLIAAQTGRDARLRFASVDEFDPASFVAADYSALDGEWRSLGEDVAASAQWGDDGLIDDDVAFVMSWGFDPAEIEKPILLVQGEADRVVPASHARYLARVIPTAELLVLPGDGHVSVLRECASAMDWLLEAF